MKSIFPLVNILLSACAGWCLAHAWFHPETGLLFVAAGTSALVGVGLITARDIRRYSELKRAQKDLESLRLSLSKNGNGGLGQKEVREKIQSAEEIIRKYFER